MTATLTRAYAAEMRRLHGNRVYAAEHALPPIHWRRAALTDLAALYYACAGPDAPPIRWTNGTSGSAPELGSAARRDNGWTNLGRRCPLFMAVHEAAHTLCPDGTGHRQRFVTMYVTLLHAHAPTSLARSLSKRLAWQNFDITPTEED